MIPSNITRDHLLQAIEVLDSAGVQSSRSSTRYDLHFNSKRYPPKEVIRRANQLANPGSPELMNFGGGAETNKFLIARGFEVAAKDDSEAILKNNHPRYWIAGATYGGTSDQTDRFFEDGIWENGYDHKYTQVTKEVKPGDFIAVKSAYTKGPGNSQGVGILKIRGKVTGNPGDGVILYVDWEPQKINREFGFLSGFRKTISELRDPEKIKLLFSDFTSKQDKTSANMKPALNTILYGPPGTGKTYQTIELALKIANVDTDGLSRQQCKEKFDTLMQEGRIVFATFHQSMSYEDFIEGIKPKMDPEEVDTNLQYLIEDGIFKRMATRAMYAYYKLKHSQSAATAISKEEIFDLAYEMMRTDFAEKLSRNEPVRLETRSGYEVLVRDISDRGNINLGHIDSTRERPYIVSKNRLFKLYEKFGSAYAIKQIDREIRATIGGANATAFWAVFKYLTDTIDKTPKTSPVDSFIESDNYDVIKEQISNFKLTKELVESAKPQPHVLIIDEINRGNVSQIFGELITLIEEDKRLGKREALTLTLPYSKEPFGVPPNLYLIGTMNTADRSVEALDTALRRRFSFVEMMPDYTLLEGRKIGRIALKTVLETINRRIEWLAGRDYQIGHSYLLEATTPDQLADAFQNKIIPLLQEYFYGDYGKIGLVLGNGFIQELKPVGGFASFEGYDDPESAKRKVYTFNKLTPQNIEAAINTLLEHG